jgi:hypothetical protein
MALKLCEVLIDRKLAKILFEVKHINSRDIIALSYTQTIKH